MYLTAQHVRSPHGAEGIHAFLHLHDVPGGGGFPPDPLSVPQQHPGRLVDKHAEIPPMGMNSLLSYLDVIAPDEAWCEKSVELWHRDLDSIGALMSNQALPWVVEAGDIHVIFSAVPAVPADAEFDALVRAALGLWHGWKQRIG